MEISTKSGKELGRQASAFNLEVEVHGPKEVVFASVECLYQGSKVFEDGSGPFDDLYKDKATSRDAKKDERLKQHGRLKEFNCLGEKWGLNDGFYDWLYLNGLLQNEDMASEIRKYTAFTDIEFNPKKSYNCQARSAARYVALYDFIEKGEVPEDDIKDPKLFKERFKGLFLSDNKQSNLL